MKREKSLRRKSGKSAKSVESDEYITGFHSIDSIDSVDSLDSIDSVDSSDPIYWPAVRRVLVIKLRSIGDTVLATPSLIALRRALADARIDVLLEDWVAPVLENFHDVDSVITVGTSVADRLTTAWRLRRNKYDVVFNLHGGTTSTLLTRAAGAPVRVGYADYQYSNLYTHTLPPSSNFWKREKTHSAEQQLALLGQVGISVDDRPRTRLDISPAAKESLARKLAAQAKTRVPTSVSDPPGTSYALLHPASLFHTKQWSAENFARVAEHLAARGIDVVAVASASEASVLDDLKRASAAPITTFIDLTLPEITALASEAKIFVGNDSGIAHVAAAVGTPAVVIFGSSNRDHWRPWTDAPNEIVFNPFECQPCPGYECAVFGEPRCILSVTAGQVISAIDRTGKW
jgi:lipopolysaccharide heptosyltransferase II